jgi:hypothetical protein
MPALKYVQGEFLDFMSDILTSSACKNRGVFNHSTKNFVHKFICISFGKFFIKPFLSVITCVVFGIHGL